ncbi:hypothetical protein ARTHROSP310_34460 [Arthrobacter sp. AD-310]
MILGSLMLKLLFLSWYPANREGLQLPEQSKASEWLALQARRRTACTGPKTAGTMPNQVPGNLGYLAGSVERPVQRLTRVGENSACKLHAILQKKFPSTR